eukprot:maker-scaffold101_size371023-snap-gene-2.27 protein:Tk03073 transcript:maker-scaffold101_size371023-snap-gene-2.27-mRNA-1 annotation:"hypothetical protein RO3G_13306"
MGRVQVWGTQSILGTSSQWQFPCLMAKYSIIVSFTALLHFLFISNCSGVGLGLGKVTRAFHDDFYFNPNPKLASHIRHFKYHGQEPNLGEYVPSEQEELQVHEDQQGQERQPVLVEGVPFDDQAESRRIYIRYDKQHWPQGQEAVEEDQRENSRIKYLNHVRDLQLRPILEVENHEEDEFEEALQELPNPMALASRMPGEDPHVVLSRYRYLIHQ